MLSVPVNPDPRPTPLSKLRDQWRPGDGPLAALENAIKIIKAFAEKERAAA